MRALPTFWRWAETLGAFLSLIAPRRRPVTASAPAACWSMDKLIVILSDLNSLGNRVLRQARPMA